jgi:hypothetical protein
MRLNKTEVESMADANLCDYMNPPWNEIYQCCAVIRICCRYSLGIYHLTWWGWKETDFGIDPWFSISLKISKNRLSNHWSSKLLVLWCFWNNWNWRFSDSDFSSKNWHQWFFDSENFKELELSIILKTK